MSAFILCLAWYHMYYYYFPNFNDNVFQKEYPSKILLCSMLPFDFNLEYIDIMKKERTKERERKRKCPFLYKEPPTHHSAFQCFGPSVQRSTRNQIKKPFIDGWVNVFKDRESNWYTCRIQGIKKPDGG